MTISPQGLLSQARDLIESNPGRPRQTDLRSIVSNSYYAVFHVITEESAKLLISGGSRDHYRNYLRRGYQHTQMSQICRRFRIVPNHQTQDKEVLNLLPLAFSNVTAEARVIADGFVKLQKDRHSADYDHTRTFLKDEVINIYEDAVSLHTTIRELDKSVDANYGFLIALFVGSRIG